ncbi:MAG: hypothetical protein JWM68_3602 [Verrucomicrobiales bacterium]|nr:hypothetical protein [Verrucomicrobiales bacterium]
MKNKMYRILILAVLVVGFAGCSTISGTAAKGDAAAIATAKATQRQLLELRRQVRRKQEAERKYYRDSIKSIDDAVTRANYIEQRRTLIEKSHSDAKALISNQAQADAMLGGQLITAANEMVASLDATAEMRKAQHEQMAKALAALEDLDEEYSALEKSLVQLSAPKEDSAQLANFLIKTGQEFKKLQNQTKPSDK